MYYINSARIKPVSSNTTNITNTIEDTNNANNNLSKFNAL